MLFCGIDASDSALDYLLRDAGGRDLAKGRIQPNLEGLGELFEELERFGKPNEIGIAVETAHAAYIQTMLDRGYVVCPVNPQSAANFRKAMSANGEKSDSIDSNVLATYLATFHTRLRALKPDAPEIITLRIACEDRVRLVEERTSKLNELRGILKVFYPAYHGLFGELNNHTALSFLEEYPTQKAMQSLSPRAFKGFLQRCGYTHTQRMEEMLKQLKAPALRVAEHLQQARVSRIVYLVRSIGALNAEIAERQDEISKQFESLPEADWIRSLPGAGVTLAPALLACVGRDPERFRDVEEARAFIGTAPVTKASGGTQNVHMRRGCWKFGRRTFQLFAEQTLRRGGWAREFYDQYRQRGHDYHEALRALAHKWVKVILAMKRTGARYDEALFHSARHSRLSKAAVGSA